MKKVLIVSIAAIMCLALALPAVAEVKISGGVNFLAYYLVGSPETQEDAKSYYGLLPGFATEGTPAELAAYGNVRNLDDRKSLQMNLSNLLTSIRATYTNAKGTYGATMGIVGGQINNWPTQWEMGLGATYMWWMIMPDVNVKLGKIDQFIGGLGPSSLIEHNEYERSAGTAANGVAQYADVIGGTQVAGLTSFGNMSTTSIPGVSIDIKVNDMVSVIFGIYDPDDDGTAVISLDTPIVSSAGPPVVYVKAKEEIVMPRLDIAVPIKIANFYIQPVASYIKRTFENVQPTVEDEFACWLFGASGSVKFGPITLSAEYIYGQNIGANNYSGPGSTSALPRTSYVVNGIRQISDIKDVAWWFQVRWQATPAIAVQAAYGQWVGSSDVNPAISTDNYHYKRSGWVANLWYSVGPNFFIVPSYSHLNLGSEISYDNILPSDTLRWSWGTVDLYGVGFYMIF